MNKYVSALSVELNRLSANFAHNDTISEEWVHTLTQSVHEIGAMENSINVLSKNIEELGKSLQKTEEKAKSFVKDFKLDKVIDGAKAASAAITNVEESTRDYRKAMANLESSSVKAGYSAEETSTSFEQLYGVLGDNSSAANTLTTLQGLRLNQSDLTGLINASIGAWASYGESIPIESLAEGIRETAKIGEATGTFSDLLIQAGINEKEFNKKLQSVTGEAERANTILELLANEGLVSAGEAWQTNNQALVETYKAASQMNEVYARVSELVAPALSSIQSTAAALAITMLDWIESGDPLVGVIAGVATALGGLAVALAISNLLDSLQSSFGNFRENLAELGNTIKTHPVLFIAALLAGIAVELVHLYNTNEEFRAKVNAIWTNVVEVFNSAVNVITTLFSETIPNTFNGLLEFFKTGLATLATIILTPISYICLLCETTIFDLLTSIQEFSDSVDRYFIQLTDKAATDFQNTCIKIETKVRNLPKVIKTAFNDAMSFISNFISGAKTWGAHMLENFISGISNMFPRLRQAVQDAAQVVRSYLHFTVPDVGPLSDADEYGPDFMKLISKGITDNVGLVKHAAQLAAGAMIIQPQAIAAGSTTSNMTQFGNVSINVYGTEGQSVNALADAVMDRMQMLVTQKEVAFSV